MQQYINKKAFAYNNQTLPALDTTVTLYAGSAAFLAKDTAAGIQYFSQELDPKNIMGELEQNWRLFDIYNYYLNTAIKKTQYEGLYRGVKQL